MESLSIYVHINNLKIRCCVAYGPQEYDNLEKKKHFWDYLNEEVIFAQHDRAGFLLQFDGNLWAGQNLIPNDPNKQNRNGKLFELFLKRNNLFVVNSLSLCEGVITRTRTLKTGKEEKSILDFFVVCSKVLPFITKMVIDEERKHSLTNYLPARNNESAIDSDHCLLSLDMNMNFKREKPNRREIFNLKNKDSQVAFCQSTSKTNKFTNCFKNNKSVTEQFKCWKKVLFTFINKSFKKIRIRRKTIKNPKVSKEIKL